MPDHATSRKRRAESILSSPHRCQKNEVVHSDAVMSSMKEPLNASSTHQLILEHVLTYPGTFDLAGTKMGPEPASLQLRNLPSQWTTPKGSKGRPSIEHSPHTPNPLQAAIANFTSTLCNHIGNSPSQPCSLPPSFSASFLRSCFPPELYLVDFPQALTGLDYLEDLNNRRRRDIRNAKQRLGVDNLTHSGSAQLGLSPGLRTWLKDVENSERKAEALFTQLYVALRRWILVNELSLMPFNPHNALAMLNILYPASRCVSTSASENPSLAPPSAKLTPQVLGNQRAVFLTYITAVEQRGTGVLKPLMDQGKVKSDPPEATGWASVAETLDNYLRVALRAIEDVNVASCREDLELPNMSPQVQSAKQAGKRKADSGYASVGQEGRPSCGTAPTTPLETQHDRDLDGKRDTGKVKSTDESGKDTAVDKRLSARTSTSNSGEDKNKPLPITPAVVRIITPPARRLDGIDQSSRGLSRLEKIALEIRKIKSRRQNIETEVDQTNYEHAGGNQDNRSTPGEQLPSQDFVPETVAKAPAQDRGRPSAMKRIKSLGDIKSYTRGKARSKSRSRPETPQSGQRPREEDEQGFDRDEMRRQRALFEAREGRAA